MADRLHASLALIRAALAALLAASCAHDAGVDAIFAKYGPGTPGCAVAVAKAGKTIVERGYGMANLEHSVPIDADTVFEAGSVSKQFTAASLLELADEGKLSLDDRVRKFIPELDASADEVTLRQMLSHTSGLRDWGTVVGIAGWPRGTRLFTQEHVVDVMSRQRALNFAPGTQWSYSNSGYNLGAVVAERIGGTTLPQFTRERFFVPVGMTHTSWRDDVARVVPHRATAYAKRGDVYRTDMHYENIYGNCCLLTTVGDLLRWNDYLDRAPTARQMETPVEPYDYGLGLFIRSYRGLREVAHSGATGGYRAWLARYPEQSLSVALLCNDGGANPTALGRQVADVYLTNAEPARPPAERAKGLFREPRLGLIADTQLPGYARIEPEGPPPLGTLAGTYVNDDAQATHQIRVVDGQLMVRIGLNEWTPLVHVHGSTFRLNREMTFTFTANGFELNADLDLTNRVARVERLRFERVAPAGK